MLAGAWTPGLAAVVAAASVASPFDGVWRSDPSTLRTAVPPIVLDLQGGTLTCRSCRPPYAIKADGGVHPMSGRQDADASSVTVRDAGHMLKVDRLKGRVTLKETFAVAPDGRSAQVELVDTALPGAPARITRETLTRVRPGAAGADGISGVWRLGANAAQRSAATETLKVSGGRLTVTTSDGRSSTLPLDGRPSPSAATAGFDAISVRRESDRVLVETDLLKGRPVLTYRFTLAPDGREISLEINDLAQGTRTTQILRKRGPHSDIQMVKPAGSA